MRRFLKTICLVVAAVVATTAINAQDLQSQRGESQDLGKLLGYRVDRGGLNISPFPQQYVPMLCDGVDINKGVKLVGEAVNYAEELRFLPQNKKGVNLTIRFYTAQSDEDEVFAHVPGA